jgi:hypothetical protein
MTLIDFVGIVLSIGMILCTLYISYEGKGLLAIMMFIFSFAFSITATIATLSDYKHSLVEKGHAEYIINSDYKKEWKLKDWPIENTESESIDKEMK